jgi:hypothetical protein
MCLIFDLDTIVNVENIEPIDMCMIPLHTRFHILNFNGLLDIIVNL